MNNMSWGRDYAEEYRRRIEGPMALADKIGFDLTAREAAGHGDGLHRLEDAVYEFRERAAGRWEPGADTRSS
jgi:hypothetical protein